MSKIRLDINDLKEVIRDIDEDGYVTLELEIIEGDFENENELKISALDIETDELISYGTLYSLVDEFGDI